MTCILLHFPPDSSASGSGIFIILGIGCDDIFVFMDAFRQSELQPSAISGSLETRFAWAYNRAALAMLSTSVTTTLAFGACAFSEIWDMRCFGVVNGFMVLADFVLVITWFPAAVVFHEKHLKHCCPWCSPHCLARAIRDRCRKVPTTPRNDETKEPNTNSEPTVGGEPKTEAVPARPDGDAQPEGHFWMTFFGGVYTDFLIQHHLFLIGIFAALLVMSTAVFVALLEPSSKPFSFFE